MPEMSTYRDGVPSWIDLTSPDVGASMTFYTGLLGWEASAAAAPEAGGYTMFTMHGKQVAGVGPIMGPGHPPAWTTYVNVTDADATAKRAADGGGTVLLTPMDVMDQGRMAVFADPEGAVLGLWQPGAHTGAQLVNEPGAYCWSELAAHDVARAKDFYATVFGWDGITEQAGPVSYTEFRLAGAALAGMFKIGPEMPADTPPHWGVYIAVANCDATVAAATRLGAAVVRPPQDIRVGRFAVLADPQGAFFRVIALTSQS
jgi:predicted enzyme related to lactoylglutathione lyase